MERTGNTTGMGPRRQDDQKEAQPGARQQRQERLANRELREAEVAVGRADQPDGAEGEATEGEATEGDPAAPPAATSQADGTPYGGTDVSSPEGVKPATRDRLEAAEVDADAERDATGQDERE